MRTCSDCGSSNPPDARFCFHCGVELADRCPRCGAELQPGARYCPTCGTPVGPPEPSEEERKLVTVLFADVAGSTSLGERLDPEQLKQVMGAYFDAMRKEIEAEGGTVEKFIGDAVMAAFGVPAAHEDDPTRALRAAIHMRRALEELNESLRAQHGVTLAMRTGVHTGEVVAVSVPRFGEGMVTGDATNVAARLEQAAEPGQILISERTARACRGFHLVEVGPLRLKGKDREVHAYELVDYEPQAIGRALRFGAPMVGRDREIALLQSIYDRVASEERPYLVTIYGDPGVGKSRLVAEFASWTGRLAAPPKVAGGRCLPYGDGVTYWPLAEILRGHAGVLHDDPPEVALQKIQAVATAVLIKEICDDPDRATAALCFTVGLEHPASSLAALEPRQVRLEVHQAWRSYFSALARTGPVVVVIEDIHWADPAMLDLLEELAERMEGPVLFLCPARPELTARRPGWGGGRLNFSAVALDPLSGEEAERLVGFLVASVELPESVRSRILERAGGNPFFLEEIIRQLIDVGQLVPSDGGWRAVGGIDDVEIPDTVQGVLAARMDLLARVEKRVLQSAAVVGRVFWPGPVTRLLEADAAAADDALRHLEDRGLVLTRLSSSMGGEQEYIFKHILTRDVAYESLPRRDRASAHATVAAWLEESAGQRQGEFVELLAHHYGEAHWGAREQGRAPEQIQHLRTKAFGYALRASDSARSKLALDNSLKMSERALTLASGPRERARALEAMAESYLLDSQGDLAWASWREAADVLLASRDADGEAVARACLRALEMATRGRGAMRSRLSRDDAQPYLRAALERVGTEEGEDLARLLIVQSFWPYSFHESPEDAEGLVEARQAGERAADVARKLGRPELESAALDGAGSYYLSEGLYGPMESLVARRLELAVSLTDSWEVGDSFGVAAWQAFHVGRYREAEARADEGFRRALSGSPIMALYCLDWRALARCRLGEWDGFLADVATAEELLGRRKDNPPGFASDHVAAAAFVHEVRGDREASDRFLDILSWLERAEDRPSPGWAVWRSLLLARRGQFDQATAELDRPEFEALRYGRGYVLEARCDVIAEREAWDEAAEVVRLARQRADTAGLEALRCYADRLEGRAAAAGGRADQAVGLLERARAGFEALEASWEAARTALSLAEALLAAGRPNDGLRPLEACRAVFERLRSLRELERAETLAEKIGPG